MYKPNANGLYQGKSLDGKPHTLDVVRKPNPSTYRLGDLGEFTCIECKWAGWRPESSTKNGGYITQPRVHNFMQHIDVYNLIKGLTSPPLPLWSGSWVSPRKKGDLFAYRVDANLPANLRTRWSGDAVKIKSFNTGTPIGTQRWTTPWQAANPWLLIEASGSNKSEILTDHQLLGSCENLGELARAAHKILSKREDKGQEVRYPEGLVPEGVEIPLPPIDVFVEGMAKIAQTTDYGQIHRALEQVQRGIIQLELLKEIEASLEAKLSIGP
jgi:hypothetical protein